MKLFKPIENDYEPLYRQIARHIKNEIVAGNLENNQQIPPEPELAELMGTSRSTLRKSLKELEEQNLIVQKKGHGTFVIYQAERTYRVAVFGIVQNTDDVFSTAAMNGLQKAFAEVKHEFIFLNNADFILNQFHNSGANALVVAIPDAEQLKELCMPFFDNIPLVLINVKSAEIQNRYCVDADSDPLKSTIEFLTRNGHKRIGYLTLSYETSNLTDRNNSYKNNIKALNLDNDKALFQNCCEHHFYSGYYGMQKLLAQKKVPTAVICAGASISAGAWQAAMEAGIKIPDELSIVGFDVPEWMNPKFSTIIQPHLEIGFYAGEILMKQIQKKDYIENKIFPVILKDRGSIKKLI